MANIDVELKGTITTKPQSGTAAVGSNGCQFGFQSRTVAAFTKENSSGTGTVDSASYIDVPIDADMLGLVLQIQVDPTAAAIDIRITSLVVGTQEVTQVTMFIIEKTTTQAITKVEVKGTSSFQWVLAGIKT